MNEQLGLKERVEPEGQSDTTALATTSQNVPAIPEDYSLEGMEGIGQADLIIPRARVLQPTSQLEGTTGEFHFNLTGTTKATILAVLLHVKRGRVWWNKDDLASAPLCASDDDVMPRDGGSCAGPCADCPNAKWGRDHTPPLCGQTYNFLAADIEDENAPFMMSLRSTSIKHAKRIISAFFLKRKPLYAAPVRIMSALLTNDKGKWYEVTFVLNSTKGFDWRIYRDMYLAYEAATVTTDTEQASDQPAPGGDDVTPIGGLDEEELPF